jgi:hypothetical protein
VKTKSACLGSAAIENVVEPVSPGVESPGEADERGQASVVGLQVDKHEELFLHVDAAVFGWEGQRAYPVECPAVVEAPLVAEALELVGRRPWADE